MTETSSERTFSILELSVWPKGCKIDQEAQPYLATVIVPQLEAAGMKTAEWTLGALQLQEPYLTMVKAVTCRGCMHFECMHNTKPDSNSTDIVDTIFDVGYASRFEANDMFTDAILPKANADAWAAKGLTVGKPFVNTSRKRLHLSFYVTDSMRVKTRIEVTRKKGEPGEIIVWAIDGGKGYPLPRSSAEIAAKLNEIVIGLAPVTL